MTYLPIITVTKIIWKQKKEKNLREGDETSWRCRRNTVAHELTVGEVDTWMYVNCSSMCVWNFPWQKGEGRDGTRTISVLLFGSFYLLPPAFSQTVQSLRPARNKTRAVTLSKYDNWVLSSYGHLPLYLGTPMSQGWDSSPNQSWILGSSPHTSLCEALS